MSDDKYLNPETNPFIPAYEDEPLKPGEEGFDGRAPFWTGDGVKRMIERAFGEELNESEVGSHRIVRMADGSFRIDGKSINELNQATLTEIGQELGKPKPEPE